MNLPVVVISDRARKRLKSKHPWIFSNEIETKPDVQPGAMVRVEDHAGHSIATGYYNPHTLIAIRILSLHSDFDLKDRIQKALAHRERFFEDPLYRLIYSESDALPGLIVDRYGETLVVQILTAGMEMLREDIISALTEVVQPARILLRNDSPYRKLEGLSQSTEWVLGDALEHQVIEMDGLKFQMDYSSGQKTGFFLDQRRNRKELVRYAFGGRASLPAAFASVAGTETHPPNTAGESMLDAFSYSGAWALYGAKAGFEQITVVDSSREALDAAQQNARLNGYTFSTVAADVFEFLRAQYATPTRFDLIVLDPPAFCKSKRNLAQAVKGYREINLRAMKLLKPGGVLITCSCSQPVSTELFLEILREASKDSGRSFHLREVPFQPPDHPVLLNFPESHYLKCAVLELLR